MRQQLRELSVTSHLSPNSRRTSITQPLSKSGLGGNAQQSPAALARLQVPSGLSDAASAKNSQGGLTSPHSWGGASPAVQSRSPSRVWGESTPPLHPSSPTKAGLSALRRNLGWGKHKGQSSPLVSQTTNPSAATSGPLSPSALGPSLNTAVRPATVQFSEPSKAWGQGHEALSMPQSSSPSRNWGTASPGVQSSKGSRTWGGATPLIQSTSPSRVWGVGTPGVQSSSPSRIWGSGLGTPPVQSSGPSFLRGWLSKQRGRSVVEEQAMQVCTASAAEPWPWDGPLLIWLFWSFT